MLRSASSILTLVLVSLAIPASAQNAISADTSMMSGSTVLTTDFYAEKVWKVSESVSVGPFVYGLASSSPWGEVYAGATVYPVKGNWLAIAFGAGVEHDPSPIRWAGDVVAIGRGNFALLVLENGGSGFWYKARYVRSLNDRIGFGFYSRRFTGTGPLLEVKATKVLTIWGMAGRDFEDYQAKGVVGIYINLQ